MELEPRFVPIPAEGTEACRMLEMAEGCSVTVCRGEPRDPYEAAAAYSGEPWCPGYCARYAALTTLEKEA